MIEIAGMDHYGIRVEDEARARTFYEMLGFRHVLRSEEARVAIVRNGAGVEINFIFNASTDNGGRNVLMDEEAKYPGYTHVALRVPSIEATVSALAELDIPISEGPVKLGPHNVSLFIRDPDRNVIELTEVSGKADAG